MIEQTKTELVRRTDPETKEPYWERVSVIVKKPEEIDRMNAVLDILHGSVTPEDVRKMYDITSINSVYTWIGKYVSQEKVLSLEEQSEEEMAKKAPEARVRELEAENRRLNKALELEKLRAEAYNTMIDLAEKTFNIPVRKKSGTKR